MGTLNISPFIKPTQNTTALGNFTADNGVVNGTIEVNAVVDKECNADTEDGVMVCGSVVTGSFPIGEPLTLPIVAEGCSRRISVYGLAKSRSMASPSFKAPEGAFIVKKSEMGGVIFDEYTSVEMPCGYYELKSITHPTGKTYWFVDCSADEEQEITYIL